MRCGADKVAEIEFARSKKDRAALTDTIIDDIRAQPDKRKHLPT